MSTFTPGAVSEREQGGTQRYQARSGSNGASAHENVGSSERAVSSLIGGALIATGAALALKRGSYGTGLGLAGVGAALIHRGATGHCSVYQAMEVNTADRSGATQSTTARMLHVEKAVSINKSPEELYSFWHNFENLGRIMPHLERVEDLGGGRSRWAAKAPPVPGFGSSVEWTAQITEDEPNRLIAWKSEPGSSVDTAGRVEFRPAPVDRGTEVHVSFDYHPPAGVVGAMVAKLFGQEPNQQVAQDLKRFKALMETGEMPSTEGQPRGTCTCTGRRQ